MQANPESRITRRQQQWIDAHEKEFQKRTPDLFGWWLDMRIHGRIDGLSHVSPFDDLRTFNAVQVAPLPFGA